MKLQSRLDMWRVLCFMTNGFFVAMLGRGDLGATVLGEVLATIGILDFFYQAYRVYKFDHPTKDR